MFEALKKKLSSWLGKPEEKKEKKAEKEKKVSKKEKKISKKPKEKKINEKVKKEKEIRPKEPAEEIIGEAEEKPKEGKGFFTRLREKFIKTEEEKEEEKVEEIIEEAEKEQEVEEEPKKEEPSEEIEEILGETEEEIEEEQEEAPKEGFFSRFFKKLSSAKITEENFNDIFQELEIILLENNVAIEVVEKIKEDLSRSLVGTEIKKTEIEQKIMSALKNSILHVLIEPENLIEKIKNKKEPFVILFFGINGSGKTTSLAKLAHKLKKANIPVVMAAADTFRAASIEQLQTHGENLGIEVISKEYGSDPAAVAFDAIQYAKKNHIRAVLIDTAGRMYTKQNLMKEMEKIVRISKPDLKIFVGESITGNDAVEQAKTFNETAGIDGIILSKADVDEKAGTILSVSYVTNKPIYYLGVGQGYEDLQDFKKSEVLKHLGIE